ncbi:MAG: hypothetical protein IKD69_03120 [Solobacterium sp.]|nr:hypothetical protein [Solobacterium sp.]
MKTRLLAYGFLLGTAGVRLLTSEDAKKVYTHLTAAVLRGTDAVIETATTLKENCEDIYADAKEINDERVLRKEAQIIEDARAILNEAKKDAE